MLCDKEVVHTDGQSVVLVIYILTFLIGFPTNMVAFYTFCKKVTQKTMPIDILLLNLTVSDLVFLLFLPFKIKEAADNMIWKMPDFLCSLTSFIFYTTIYNSTFFLTAISVDRYLSVAFPIQYKLKRRPLYAIGASFFFWVISMAHISIVYIMQYIDQSNTNTNSTQKDPCRCYENFTQEQLKVLMPVRLEVFLVLFCVPFLICCFCYINFVWILSHRPNINPKRRLRAIGLSLGTLLVFIVCFAPFNLSHMVGFIKWESPSWRVEAVLTSTINASLDPIIFYFSSSALRATFHYLIKSLMQVLCCGCKAVHSPLLFCSRTQDSRENPSSSSL
ncbi:free fatty acid receptor 2 [Esox lucius]|uniref:G-protein coupled receptors family 1 profile domain-containing protein n=1 Tax=Esox lucius TaxID=8010 RepID=A0A3P9A813_ESOLU|nr:free fatty acid receptor 2 [Esox lucius]